MEKKKIVLTIVAVLIGVLAFFTLKYALLPVFENIKINKELKEAAELDNQYEEIARVKILINDPVTAVD